MSAYDIQVALYNKLNADVPLNAVATGVYDNPAQVADSGDGSEFPFVTIGNITLQPWDDDTSTGFEATIIIDTWSRATHTLECKQVQGLIYDTLHRQTLTISGLSSIMLDFVTSSSEKDPDGVTVHGISEFRLIAD